MPKSLRAGKAAILSAREIDKLRAAIGGGTHRTFFELARYTGERPGALVQVAVRDCFSPDGNPREFILFRGSTRKGHEAGYGSTREVPCHPELRRYLASIEIPQGYYLFPSPLDPTKHMGVRAFDLRLRRACKSAKLQDRGISLYSFRRTFLTELSEAGVGIERIQSLSGHKSIQSLRGYLDVSEKSLKSAISMLA